MIKTLGTRYPEIGRVRLGEKGPKGEPVKGTHLRFSSNDDVVLKALASQLGGDVVRWEKGEQEWQLTTESESVDVYLPPDPIDTAYELWGKAGCARRCDGERCTYLAKGPDGEYMDTADCLCVEEGRTPGDRKDKEACNVTVRLRLVIPDVPGVGVWICTSHSIYAAMELPGQVNVLEAAGAGGGLIPATFAIEQRSEKKPYEKYPRRYIVPVLRVRKSLAQLVAGASNGALAAEPRPALVAGVPDAGSGGPPSAPAPDRADLDRPTSQVSPPTPPPAASPPSAAGDGGPSLVFIRHARAKAKRMWPGSDDEGRDLRLGTILDELTDGRVTSIIELSGPADSNALMAELDRIAAAS